MAFESGRGAWARLLRPGRQLAALHCLHLDAELILLEAAKHPLPHDADAEKPRRIVTKASRTVRR